MDFNYILASIIVFLAIILVLVLILLVAKRYLLPSGKVKITVNGKKTFTVPQVCFPLCPSKVFICRLHAEERALAVNANAKFFLAEARFLMSRSSTLRAVKSLITIGLVASAR